MTKPDQLTARQLLYYLQILIAADNVLRRYKERNSVKAALVAAYYFNATGADLSRRERMQFVDLVARDMGWIH